MKLILEERDLYDLVSKEVHRHTNNPSICMDLQLVHCDGRIKILATFAENFDICDRQMNELKELVGVE